jgi:hypothetical protein
MTVCGFVLSNVIMEERLTAVPCAICHKPVRLDECKVSDLGEPAHEGCLAERLKDEIRKRKPLERWQV